MRTVSFSSDKIRQRLTKDLVPVTINITGDPSSGSSCSHAPTDQPGICSRGIGHQNVQSLFLTPQGEIFHAVSGFQSPEDLENEIAFALETYQLMKRSPQRAKAIDEEAHQKRLRTLGFSDNEVRQSRNDFLGGSALFLLGNDQGNKGRANNGTGGNFLDQMMAGQAKRQVLRDHVFSIDHPLMPFKDFARQPQLLVGKEKTSFSSVSNGGASGGKFGK